MMQPNEDLEIESLRTRIVELEARLVAVAKVEAHLRRCAIPTPIGEALRQAADLLAAALKGEGTDG